MTPSLFLPVSGRCMPHAVVGEHSIDIGGGEVVAFDRAIKEAEAAGFVHFAAALRVELAKLLELRGASR